MANWSATRILLVAAVPAAVIGLIFDGLAGLRLAAFFSMIFAVIVYSQDPLVSKFDAITRLAFFATAFAMTGRARWLALFASTGLAIAYLLLYWVRRLLRLDKHRSNRAAGTDNNPEDSQ